MSEASLDSKDLKGISQNFVSAVKSELPVWFLLNAQTYGLENDADWSQESGSLSESIVAELKTFLGLDIGVQLTTPLTIVRGASSALINKLVSDNDFSEQEIRTITDSIEIKQFSDIGELCQEASLYWGAAKTHEFLRRRNLESDTQ